MKSLYNAIIGTVFMTSSFMAHAIKSPEELKLVITSGHNRAFGKDNLITERLTPTESNLWNEAVSAVGDYIRSQAPTLTADFDRIQQASNNLINSLKMTYASYIAPIITGGNKQTGVQINAPNSANKADWKKINLKGIDMNLSNLKNTANDLDEILNKLKALKTSRSTPKEAIDLLIYLANFTQATVEKAYIKDLNKLKIFIHTL